MTTKSKILDVQGIDQKIKRLAWQVYEKNLAEKEIIVVGISERGLMLAKQLAVHIQEISKIKTKLAHLELDKDNPYNKEVALNLEIKEYTNKVVVLVDDVLNSLMESWLNHWNQGNNSNVVLKDIKEKMIAGAAIDVLATEPPTNDHPYIQLLSRPNFILTPHIAWASTEAMQTLSDQMIENIENFVDEKPSNIVS